LIHAKHQKPSNPVQSIPIVVLLVSDQGTKLVITRASIHPSIHPTYLRIPTCEATARKLHSRASASLRVSSTGAAAGAAAAKHESEAQVGRKEGARPEHGCSEGVY